MGTEPSAPENACLGEYDDREEFCREGCPDGPRCLRLKARVLFSCLPRDLERLQARMRVEEKGETNARPVEEEADGPKDTQ